ncbi:hypothetical protein [Paenibacillus elgii]|uniref:hypothetical protein n=1 Tax=Paenibacillus elgii TaxID=189691 RepID=UPI0013CF91EB|nr:hypothetical protein [Paenibacillus elgii]
MGVHYFGMKIDGKRCRFFGRFSDDEFEAAVKQVGGELPKKWVAWHFNDGEDISNSKRVQAFAQIPEIKVRHWSGGYYSALREQVVDLLIKDSQLDRSTFTAEEP